MSQEYVILSEPHPTAPMGFVARSSMLHEDTKPFQLFTNGATLDKKKYYKLWKMTGDHLPNISNFEEAKKHNRRFKLVAKKLFKVKDQAGTIEAIAEAMSQKPEEIAATGPEIAGPYKSKNGFKEPTSAAKLSREEKKAQIVKELMDELDGMIGLQSVKKHIRMIVNFQLVAEKRRAKGLPVPIVSHHLAFEGPPGTGKTTIARLVARIYHALGVIQNHNVIETDRAGLVGAHIGETALKTERQIERAKGGVLFIDEAYALARGGEKDYGREAVSTLLKAMEDQRGSLVVIFAGYAKEMENLWRINSGLKSRVPERNRIDFPSYSPEELVEIGKYISEQSGYSLSEDACDTMQEKAASVIKDGKFGNGRWVRDLIETAIMNQANRIVEEGGELDELHAVDLELQLKD